MLTPNDYINKAIHAINTDQPNLAMLYMRRGYKEMQALRPDGFLDVQYALYHFREAMMQVGKAFERLGRVFNQGNPSMLHPSRTCCTGRDGDDCHCYCHNYTRKDFALV